MKKEYSPINFRKSLLDRVKKLANGDPAIIQRVQKQVAFDRLLCRLFSDNKTSWILKGGHAIELRFENARATKDIDIALKEVGNYAILELLRDKVSADLGDYFSFEIRESVLDLEAAPYGGARFPVDAKIDGKIFSKFHIDVGVGDIWIEPHEKIELKDWLNFAGIKTTTVSVISKEQHFAEKIHAYTLPRESRYNSRVKDLVDMIILIQNEKMDMKNLKKAIKETFARRKTHEIPLELLIPPSEWQKPFDTMAEECGLKVSLESAFKILVRYYSSLNN
jgi:predicted nucleotidyltransferase component of viral defense system